MKKWLLLIFYYCGTTVTANPKLTINDAWIRLAPTNTSVHALYANIHNHSQYPIKLIRVTSPWFERIELHRTQKIGDVTRMVKQTHMPIASESVLRLKPRSWHIMLMHKKANTPKLSLQQQVPFTLTFSDGQQQAITATVQKDQSKGNYSRAHTHRH